METAEWILCPICKGKAKTKMREDTVLENFPLFCPEFKQETLINVEQFDVSVINETK